MDMYFHLGGGCGCGDGCGGGCGDVGGCGGGGCGDGGSGCGCDPRGERCIATLACLALLRRSLLKLTSPGWLTFPNEPSDQIQPCSPHSLLIRIRVQLSPIVILCSLLKGRLLNSLKESPSDRLEDECQHIEEPQSTRVGMFQSYEDFIWDMNQPFGRIRSRRS